MPPKRLNSRIGRFVSIIEGDRFDVMLGLKDDFPVDRVRRMQQSPAPVGADEDAATKYGDQRRVGVRDAFPLESVRRRVCRPLADGDETLAGPGDRC